MGRRRKRVEPAEVPAVEVPAVKEPVVEEMAAPAPEPAPVVPVVCPHCGAVLRIVLTKMSRLVKGPDGEEKMQDQEAALCASCCEKVEGGQDVLERRNIGDIAMAQFGLMADDMTPYLPTEGAHGIKIISGGRGVRLYTKRRGTLIYRMRKA
jgi:hypothetical protein